MRTLLLNPPSFSDPVRDRREAEVHWYPVDLCRTAAVLTDSKVVDAPAHQISALECIEMAADFELVVLLTSTSEVSIDLKLAEMMKIVNPKVKVALVGPGVPVQMERSLENTAVDLVVHGEYCSAIADFANGEPHERHQAAWVTKIYQRDLDIRRYFVPYLLYPYISMGTWRAVDDVAAEIDYALRVLPEVREVFFDDYGLFEQKSRVLELCSKLRPLRFTWSCKSTVATDYETLQVMRDSGCRLVVVESPGDGFTTHCRKLGLAIHGQGLPTKSRMNRLLSFVGGPLRHVTSPGSRTTGHFTGFGV
jgi:hypothetical protein